MTTDQQDVYSSHAAFSSLASTLLPRVQAPSQHKKTSNQTPTWNLEPSINEFFDLSRYRNDRRELLRCGTTIGLSWLREWGDANLQHRDLLGDVSRRLLTLFLAGLIGAELSQDEKAEEEQQDEKKRQTTTTRVFIIHPVHSTMFAPETLFKDLLEARRDHDDANETIPESQAISLLDTVELLPVHDISSATQAISQVSDALSNIHAHFRRTSAEQEDEYKGGREETQPPTTLVAIEGLDTMAEDVIHNSNAMRGSAVLTPVLRTLTHLSRTHASFLSVLLVNTTPLGSPMSSQQQQSQSQTRFSSSSETSSSTQQSSLGDGRTTRTTATAVGGLYSAFARDFTHLRSLDGDNRHQGQTQPLLNTLLSRTLDQGIDTHLLLQSKRGQALVEVIKDRTGDGLGKWCIWRDP